VVDERKPLWTAVVYTFFIGNMTAMLLRANTQIETHRLGLSQVESYLCRRKVPEQLRLLCRQNMQTAFERGDGNDEEQLLAKLPRSLRRNVLRHVNWRVLRCAPIFFRCDRALVGAICSVLRRAIYVTDEIIAREGEVVRELSFVESGSVIQATTTESDDEGDASEQEGGHAGADITAAEGFTATDIGTALCDVAFVFGVRQHATLMAREPTSCLALSRYDYKSILGEFPTEARRVQDNVLEQVKMRGPAKDATAEELDELMEQRRQGALFELLSAASDGEVETVRSLLTGTERVELDIDACDYDKRTALHVAASEGQVLVVEALLKEGAEVNVRDRWGGESPMDERRPDARGPPALADRRGEPHTCSVCSTDVPAYLDLTCALSLSSGRPCRHPSQARRSPTRFVRVPSASSIYCSAPTDSSATRICRLRRCSASTQRKGARRPSSSCSSRADRSTRATTTNAPRCTSQRRKATTRSSVRCLIAAQPST
jgi:hypothetical protein